MADARDRDKNVNRNYHPHGAVVHGCGGVGLSFSQSAGAGGNGALMNVSLEGVPTSRATPVGAVVSYMALRQIVGWIGSLLPVVLLLGNWIFGSGVLPHSVSGYYYTVMRNIFVGTLCALGIFLIGYRGYDRWDRWITSAAGAFAIGVALFPTKPSAVVPTFRQNLVGNFHLFFAVSMFITLAVMALRFSKTAPGSQQGTLRRRALAGIGFEGKPQRDQRRRKRWRNLIYRICGFAIVGLVFLAVVLNFLPASFKKIAPWLFIIEALAVFAFGFSWFVKGQTLSFLKDEPVG